MGKLELYKTGYLANELSRIEINKECEDIEEIKKKVVAEMDEDMIKNEKEGSKYCEVCKTNFDNVHYHWSTEKHEKAWNKSYKKCSSAFEKIESELDKKYDFSEADTWGFSFGNEVLDINFQQQLLAEQKEVLDNFKVKEKI